MIELIWSPPNFRFQDTRAFSVPIESEPGSSFLF